VGQRIIGVSLRWPRHIVEPSPSSFGRRIRGQVIRDVDRRGKFIVLPLDRDSLMFHLMMSGDLFLSPPGTPRGRHDHTIFRLASGWQLRFSDPRKFGRVFLVTDPETVLGRLGPEPLSNEFKTRDLQRILHHRKRILKPLLLDQAALAGLGNIYADEALHRAKLHPLRRSHTLDSAEVKALWKGIRATLRDGLRHNGASIDWVYRGGDFQNHFRVYGREGEPCPRCGTAIERMIVGQRSTYSCPYCQRFQGQPPKEG
ncbi:MAG: bifunctional DNA-formamidopyrimidine glycosylase/DNA-(apurinic or apyrimidinic site) lyase, partial [Chloroflexota bacterium]